MKRIDGKTYGQHVREFGKGMVKRLPPNDHKTGWNGLPMTYLILKLHEELGEIMSVFAAMATDSFTGQYPDYNDIKADATTPPTC